MIDEIARGIKDRIDSTAGATLRGYIADWRFNTVPAGTAFPFLTVTCISDIDYPVFGNQIDYTHWQFDIWDDNLDPMATGHLKDITNAIRTLFDGVTLTVGDDISVSVSRTYDSLDTLTYDDMDLLTYDGLDVMTSTSKEYDNFGTVYLQQRDIPQEEQVLHRALEYEIWTMKN